ncbi:MAG: hypothetical protein JST79_12135 [Acidobacteria bacterium]|nr:hypothetical protein [Acidobacteriota bacterium]
MRSLVLAISFLSSPLWMWAGGRDLLLADVSSQAVQNARADADKLSRMQDMTMLRRFVQEGYLVSVPQSTRHYYLHSIPAPYQYCRPFTKQFLERISSQYQAKFKTRLRVSSMVRTVGRQMKLARWNSNAADATGALQSSHLTGATIDISKRDMSPQARRWMRDVLYSLRRQGYIYAIEEFNEPVFHVMVYANYPRYVRQLGRARTVAVNDSSPEDVE